MSMLSSMSAGCPIAGIAAEAGKLTKQDNIARSVCNEQGPKHYMLLDVHFATRWNRGRVPKRGGWVASKGMAAAALTSVRKLIMSCRNLCILAMCSVRVIGTGYCDDVVFMWMEPA